MIQHIDLYFVIESFLFKPKSEWSEKIPKEILKISKIEKIKVLKFSKIEKESKF